MRPERGVARTSTRWPNASGASRSAARVRTSDGSSRDPGAASAAIGVSSSKLGAIVAERLVAVDPLDVDQRAVALPAARRPRRAGDLVAGAQLAATHLGSRDVDVVAVPTRARSGAGSRSAAASSRALRSPPRWPPTPVARARAPVWGPSARPLGRGLAVRSGSARARGLGSARKARRDRASLSISPISSIAAQEPKPRHAQLGG